MFKWLFNILIFATSGEYQNKEKPLKRQKKLGLIGNQYKAWNICITLTGTCTKKHARTVKIEISLLICAV